MSKTEFRMRGIKEVTRNLAKLERETDSAARRALKRKAESVLRVSKQKFVPVKESVLRSSGVTWQVEKIGRVWKVRITFGGAASAYALAIHEHPSAYSPPSWKGNDNINFKPRGRGPKYLKKAVDLARPTFTKDIGEMIRADIAKRNAARTERLNRKPAA